MNINVLPQILVQYEAFLKHIKHEDHPVLLLGFLTAVRTASARTTPLPDAQRLALLDHEIDRLTDVVLSS